VPAEVGIINPEELPIAIEIQICAIACTIGGILKNTPEFTLGVCLLACLPGG